MSEHERTPPRKTVFCNHSVDAAHAERTLDWYRAEVERLTRERDNAKDGWYQANGVADLAMKHRDMAEAEVERLQKIVDDDEQDYVITSRNLRSEVERLNRLVQAAAETGEIQERRLSECEAENERLRAAFASGLLAIHCQQCGGSGEIRIGHHAMPDEVYDCPTCSEVRAALAAREDGNG